MVGDFIVIFNHHRADFESPSLFHFMHLGSQFTNFKWYQSCSVFNYQKKVNLHDYVLAAGNRTWLSPRWMALHFGGRNTARSTHAGELFQVYCFKELRACLNFLLRFSFSAKMCFEAPCSTWVLCCGVSGHNAKMFFCLSFLGDLKQEMYPLFLPSVNWKEEIGTSEVCIGVKKQLQRGQRRKKLSQTEAMEECVLLFVAYFQILFH